ncbi:hypothetical protein DL770_004816 [Monosporascus sp. CRB-9-2]|nr:hypothetical protein DL770_004816 [Monosporascus sp. CRB-9-2]
MTTSASPSAAATVPAQLGFLAIFNPTLGTTDETIDDQIVYYASVNTQSRKKKRHRSRGKPTEDISQDERNERLRQIGLAQGMAEFSRGFSRGKAVDTIETEKSRGVLHELEPGWWILASIDLTKLPLPPRLGASNDRDDPSENVEYSSREIKPAALLLQDLLRAHSIFLLHHAASLSALFVRTKRNKFVSILSRYWDLFLSTWNVMLHGNPATNVFGGIKIAACGELGVGVGEEDRGSGEREVLEGFMRRTEGLVDLIVSKFGSSDAGEETDSPVKDKAVEGEHGTRWLGTGDEPTAEDGAIFLGVGALSRKSLRDVTYWMEDLFSWGENAYGVKDNPSSARQPRRSRRHSVHSKTTDGKSNKPTGQPDNASSKQSTSKDPPAEAQGARTASPAAGEDATDEGGITRYMQYLKLGYGTHWSLGGSGDTGDVKQDKNADGVAARDDGTLPTTAHKQPTPASDATGHFLIGLMGNVEENGANSPSEGSDHLDNENQGAEYNSRVLLRTLTVELDNHKPPEAELTVDLGSRENELTTTTSGRKDSMDPDSHFDSQDRNKAHRLRVVVYVNKPFIYTFLFRNMADCLAWDSFYRSLHYQLAPLRKPLCTSTMYRPGKPDLGAAASSIFDLVWDPRTLTIHSTIPNIPDPLQITQTDFKALWSRAEAVNTHNQILNTYIAVSADSSELERTCKTSRGWWIVWTRILDRDASGSTTPQGRLSPEQRDSDDNSAVSARVPSGATGDRPIPSSHGSGDSCGGQTGEGAPQPPPEPKISKEIFLIRRAGERAASHLKALSTSYAEGRGAGAGGGWTDGAGRLAQGIGVDTKKYIEGLLSLTR